MLYYYHKQQMKDTHGQIPEHLQFDRSKHTQFLKLE